MVRMLFLRDIDVDIEIRCRSCGHRGTLSLFETRLRFGPSYPVLSIAPHFRCSRCDSRDTECAPAGVVPDEPPPLSIPETKPSPVPEPAAEDASDAVGAWNAPSPDEVPDALDLEDFRFDLRADTLLENAFPMSAGEAEEIPPPPPPLSSSGRPSDPERDELAALRAAIAAAVGDTDYRDADEEEPLLLDESVELKEPSETEPPASRSPFAIRDREPAVPDEFPDFESDADLEPSVAPLDHGEVVAPPSPIESETEIEPPEFPLVARAPSSLTADVEAERAASIQGAMTALRDLVEAAADEPPAAVFAPPPLAGPEPKSKEAFETTLARLRTLLDLEEGEKARPDTGTTVKTGARLFRKRR